MCAKPFANSLLHALSSLGLMLSIPATFLELRFEITFLISLSVVGERKKLF